MQKKTHKKIEIEIIKHRNYLIKACIACFQDVKTSQKPNSSLTIRLSAVTPSLSFAHKSLVELV